MSGTITRVTPVIEATAGAPVQVVRKGNNYDLAVVRAAFSAGKFRREDAGPGWSGHNAILIPAVDPDPVIDLGNTYEPWWGTWLVTIEEDRSPGS